MPVAIVRPSTRIRCAVILAAAVALILPLPARCASCTAGATDCSRCQAAHTSSAPPTRRSCCDQHTVASRNATSVANCSSHVQSKTCACKMQVPDRTYVAPDRQTIVIDLFAMLSSAQPLVTNDTAHANLVATAFGSLPPPVPHRILHCSWII